MISTLVIEFEGKRSGDAGHGRASHANAIALSNESAAAGQDLVKGKTSKADGKEKCLEAELYSWLQRLDPKSRRVIIARRFTEEQRLALERWILKRKVSDAGRVGRLRAAKMRFTGTVKLGKRDAIRVTGLTGSAQWKRLPRSGSRGVHACTKGGRLRYCASASVGPFLVTTRYLPDLSQALRFRDVLGRMQSKMESCADQPGLVERSFRAVLEEERDRLGQDLTRMDLRFSVTVMAKYWVGTALKTPQFSLGSSEGLEAGLRAFQLLHQARNLVYKGRTNRHSILRWHSPEELDQAWNRIRGHYLAVWADAGFSLARVAARLKNLEERHRPQRLRLLQRWKAKQGAPVKKQRRKCNALANPRPGQNLASEDEHGLRPQNPESQIERLLACWKVQGSCCWPKQGAEVGEESIEPNDDNVMNQLKRMTSMRSCSLSCFHGSDLPSQSCVSAAASTRIPSGSNKTTFLKFHQFAGNSRSTWSDAKKGNTKAACSRRGQNCREHE
mmetsp:Transcript_93323/g.165942  ORF Transcript_93323/g.165942 Transcript_93323/m.165942 type:complete len:502 (+) Transcript_93323:71-1576(+)|eukprot:CAMPEP_0197629500 /NCGR_PEP_ID=MMETSP1338-20131121/7319_1 /TAXON_ID=43686 ORGANISM="Pelagodinium beii, Strain RCC1491" /NCGR_SAMPLE_ID=MMETSP1338 /ASSEMBLY_ACC=CAM_ASM_000754 /LENGTH=501 /DNA_ID=CAMNT_0043200545 /DNA_START=175 /DNA_END=1680 /DNA_ORIENTATION=-